jgi:hypothetical protein
MKKRACPVPPERVKKLEGFMKKQRIVSTAYIFGSVAEGRAGPLSDIDIAVCLKGRPKGKVLSGIRLALINGISSVLGTDRFDLVVMDEAPLLMKYNIIKSGLLLKRGAEMPEREARIVLDYLDRKYYEDLYASIVTERVSRGGIL